MFRVKMSALYIFLIAIDCKRFFKHLLYFSLLLYSIKLLQIYIPFRIFDNNNFLKSVYLMYEWFANSIA